jgi:hypothetical protein
VGRGSRVLILFPGIMQGWLVNPARPRFNSVPATGPYLEIESDRIDHLKLGTEPNPKWIGPTDRSRAGFVDEPDRSGIEA